MHGMPEEEGEYNAAHNRMYSKGHGRSYYKSRLVSGAFLHLSAQIDP